MREVLRYDAFQLKPSVRTPEGYLICEATAAAAGVLEYQQADGSIRRELVTPETLQDVETLGSLALKPVTEEHPPVPVTAENVDQYGVGKVLSEVDYLDGFVRVRLLVDRADTIRKIDADDGFRGTSPAYVVQLDETPGVHPTYGRYDAIQVSRTNNHFALTKAPRGGFDRASFRVDALPEGAAVMVRTDGRELAALLNRAIDAKVNDETSRADVIAQMANAAGISPGTVSQILRGEIDRPPDTRLRGFARVLGVSMSSIERTLPKEDSTKPGVRTMPQINIDGVTYEVDDVATARAIADALKRRDDEHGDLPAELQKAMELIEAFKAQIAERDEQMDAIRAERDGLQGQLDTLSQSLSAAAPAVEGDGDGDGEPGEVEGDAGVQGDALTEADQLAWFNDRVELVAVAGRLNVDSADTLDNDALRKAVVEAHRGDALPADVTDAYVRGAYEMIRDAEARRDDAYQRASVALAKPRGGNEATAATNYKNRLMGRA